MQQRLRHHIGARRDHHAVADVEHGGRHQRRRADQRLQDREAEATHVVPRPVEHQECAVGHGSAPRVDVHDQRGHQRRHEREGRHGEQAHVVRVRGEGVDDRARQDQVELGLLDYPVVAVAEQSEAFEQVAGGDDEQQGDRLDECGHGNAPGWPVALTRFDNGWQRMTTDVVREMGLEPTRPKTQEPKSCAATITPLARIAGRGRNRNRRLCKTLGRGCAAPRAVEPLDRIELSTCSLRVSRSTD